METASPLIRPARPSEAIPLSEIALRSKAFWGYDPAFIEACRAELTFTPAQISRYPTFVLLHEELPRGFAMLGDLVGTEVELTALFVLPESIGHGYGRQLLAHCIRVAGELGATSLLVESDPHAEAFYRACGGVLIGSRPSGSIPGRMLPLLRIGCG